MESSGVGGSSQADLNGEMHQLMYQFGDKHFEMDKVGAVLAYFIWIKKNTGDGAGAYDFLEAYRFGCVSFSGVTRLGCIDAGLRPN